MAHTYAAIIATEGQRLAGGFRQPWLYADGEVEHLLGTDIVQTTATVRAGDRVLVVTPAGEAIPATVVDPGARSGELLIVGD